MPTLMTSADMGGTGGIDTLDPVGFVDPDDFDREAEELIARQAIDGKVGGIKEPEVIGSRGFVPQELGNMVVRRARSASLSPYAGRAARMVYPDFIHTNRGWKAVN